MKTIMTRPGEEIKTATEEMTVYVAFVHRTGEDGPYRNEYVSGDIYPEPGLTIYPEEREITKTAFCFGNDGIHVGDMFSGLISVSDDLKDVYYNKHWNLENQHEDGKEFEAVVYKMKIPVGAKYFKFGCIMGADRIEFTDISHIKPE